MFLKASKISYRLACDPVWMESKPIGMVTFSRTQQSIVGMYGIIDLFVNEVRFLWMILGEKILLSRYEDV